MIMRKLREKIFSNKISPNINVMPWNVPIAMTDDTACKKYLFIMECIGKISFII